LPRDWNLIKPNHVEKSYTIRYPLVDAQSNLRYKRIMIKRALTSISILVFVLTSCTLPFNRTGENRGIPSGTNSAPQLSPTPTITPTPQPQARITLGQADILNGDYEKALAEFWSAREQSTDPEVIQAAQLGVGRVLLLQNDINGAVSQLNWLLTNFAEGESRDTAYFFLGQAYERLQQYLLAADAYQNYVDASPGPLDSEILEMKGDALVRAGEFGAAKLAFLAALKTAQPIREDTLQLKIAQAAAESGGEQDAISIYWALLENSSADYIKAQSNLLLGRLYLKLGMPEQAYARFQDSVTRFPTYYDTYSGLVTLVEDGQPVNDLMRGIVDYYAGQYSLAVIALERYMLENPDHDGTPLYYKAYGYYRLGDIDQEIAAWNELIEEHPFDQYLATAYLEKASSMWRYQQDYEGATNTLLHYAARYPDSARTPEFLFLAGKILEIGGYLTRAAETWQRVFNEYPGAEQAYPALFKAGIVYYRLQRYEDARLVFQRMLVLSTSPEDQAAARFWIAKCLEAEDKDEQALTYYQQAADADPTGYYGIRGGQKSRGEPPFPRQNNNDIAMDTDKEKKDAEKWLRATFSLDQGVDLHSYSDLSNNPLFQRGEEYWKLGLRDNARNEFEQLRKELEGDAVNLYRLMNHMLDLGFYQTASLSSRQILDLAGLSQDETLTKAPIFFNHIRFGVFYRDLVVPAAIEHGLDPLLIFSLIRQESLFDASITSSAGAHGLMQITGDTGETIVNNYGWPENYTVESLDRPFINVRLGTHFLKIWIDKYQGEITPALSSYNAGDGNTIIWKGLAGDDVDLLVELIRFDETRDYIKYITENYEIYKTLYSHP